MFASKFACILDYIWTLTWKVKNAEEFENIIWAIWSYIKWPFCKVAYLFQIIFYVKIIICVCILEYIYVALVYPINMLWDWYVGVGT